MPRHEVLEPVRESPFIKAGFFWTDQVYMTYDCNYTSMVKWNDEYMTFRERFQSRYGNDGYVMNDMMLVRAGTAKRVDFGALWSTLRSNDGSLLESNAWMFEGDCKYLDTEATETPTSMF